MVTLTDLAENTERNNRIIQRALREIDEQVLAQALVDMTEQQSEIVFRNMSPRGKDGVVEAIEQEKKNAGPGSRRRATEILQQLLTTMTKYAKADTDNEQAWLPEHLPATTPDETIETIVGLSRFVRAQGYLSLEEVADTASDPLLRKGIELLADGWDALQLRSVLETYKRTALETEARRLDILVDGLESIAMQDLTHTLTEKLLAYLPPRPEKR
ncbi:MAG: hypothetical protein EA383_03755 [Spirochaetaceae bacterium]|nr:MAG: hypothetical protein EA383_03755 [Spirochaetaceae bacterium]